ncbi:hypothetical protein WA158_002232 [Blastocystis sp. Blastoise]
MLLAFAEITCNSDSQSSVTLRVSGPLSKEYSDETNDVFTIALSYYNGDNIIVNDYNFCFLPAEGGANTGNYCQKTYSFSYKQIEENTASVDLCFPFKGDGNNANVVNFDPAASTVFGACLELFNSVENSIYYTKNCYYSSENLQTFNEYFVSESQTEAAFTGSLKTTVYVDSVNPFVLHPTIALSVANDAVTVNQLTATYIQSIEFNSDPQISGLSFDEKRYVFSGTVSFTGDSASVSVLNNQNTNTQYSFTLTKFSCSGENAGKYPVILTLSHKTARYNLIFRIEQGETVIGSTYLDADPTDTWPNELKRKSEDGDEIYELGICLEPGDYSLTMSMLYISGPFVNQLAKGQSWPEDSFLTISVLSGTAANGLTHDFNGYTVGDFAFTASLEDDHLTPVADTTTTFSIGPKECKTGERVVIIDKLGSTEAGFEGFSIYSKDISSGETTLLNTYVGFASLYSSRFSPVFRTFVCLAENQYYTIRAFSKGDYEVTNNVVTLVNECPAWSTDLSVESLTYYDIYTRTEVTQRHTSLICVSVLSENSYYGGEFISDPEYNSFCSNGNAVLNDATIDRNDIIDAYTCEHSFDFYLYKYATFISKRNDDTNYVSKTIEMKESDVYNFKFVCNEQDDSSNCKYIESYSIICSLSNADDATPVDCGTYGIVLDGNTITSLAINGDDTAVTVYLTIIPNVKSEYYYYKGVSDKFTITINKLPPPANAFTVKQDNVLAIPKATYQSDITTFICKFDNDVPLTANEVTIEDDSATNHYNIQFSVSSYSSFSCTLGDHSFDVYVRPVCKDLDGYMLQEHGDVENPVCNENGYTTQTLCAYNPMIKRAELVYKTIPCRSSVSTLSLDYNENMGPEDESIPAGHTEVTSNFCLGSTITTDYPSIKSNPSWYFKAIETSFKEAFTVPLRDVYVIRRYVSDESDCITVLFDAPYGEKDDIISLLDENGFMDSVNGYLQTLDNVHFTDTLGFEHVDSNGGQHSAMCATEIVTEVKFLYYPDNVTATPVVATLNNIQFNSTYAFYYSYTPIPDYLNATYNGQLTRLCKPTYFDSVFTDVSTNSLVQVIDLTWWDLPMVVYITGFDVRAANFDVRYALQRALTRLAFNDPTGVFEHMTRDVNVYNVHGVDVNHIEDDDETAIVNPDPRVYKDTAFSVVIRVKDNTEIADWYDHMNAHICLKSSLVRGQLREGISDLMLGFMQKQLGKDKDGSPIFKLENREMRLYLPDYYDPKGLPTKAPTASL